MDTPGVSRDESMSSRLAPGTNTVVSIPEIVEDGCGILAPSEDVEAMAQGMVRLFEEPDTFASLSSNAARRVRYQSCISMLIQTEFSLLTG